MTHAIDLPAGAGVRMTASARRAFGAHRWDIRVLCVATGEARASFGSHIGGADIDQRLEIPAQDVDCRLEVRSRHAVTGGGWADDDASIEEDTPDILELGFCDLARPLAAPGDVRLRFAFAAPRRPAGA
ncbi:MAG: hypothetical protein JNK30_11140 [Phenylobacterium sp.]|uniref:hypothetical protein n=1 Tax=Phenylobacterium sp. TaxID=1871053 RepID=UPI001A3B19D2|nr:hypothetical protein [Phenylobacterium sp.]MBL8771926.1 hypothetical protein [Phenylobacterium sp.]